MAYDVRIAQVAERPTAVVAATTTWEEFPTLWKPLLDDVWAFLRGTDAGAGLWRRGRNVMRYSEEPPDVAVEVGVEVTRAFPPYGRVVSSSLPGGRVATTVHRGPYGGLGAAHEAVKDWCAARDLELTGVRWEVYGHWRDDAEPETEVCWLLA